MATVVAILLNIVRPDLAFFGQKDAQQAAVLKRMVRDLAFDTKVVVLPIVREESGLAMSSRNAYLTDEQKRAATVLHRGLSQASQAYSDGERSAERLVEIVSATIAAEPLARVDYISLNDAEDFQPLVQVEERPALLSVAVYIGKTRLIDNMVMGVTREAGCCRGLGLVIDRNSESNRRRTSLSCSTASKPKLRLRRTRRCSKFCVKISV